MLRLAGNAPVELFSCSAAMLGIVAVEQKAGCAAVFAQRTHLKAWAHAKGLDHRIFARETFYCGGRFFSVQLQDTEIRRARDPQSFSHRSIHENAHRGHTLRHVTDDFLGARKRNSPRAVRVEIKSQGIRASAYRELRVLPAGDPAKFYARHFGTPVFMLETAAAEVPSNSRNPSDGSDMVIRCSPIRKASNPAARSRVKSSCVRIPDSLTAIHSSGISLTSSSDVSRRTSNVFKSRLFTPIIFASASCARCNSFRECTSTSGSIFSCRPSASSSRSDRSFIMAAI